MPTVRLSGTVAGSQDPNRTLRAQLLHDLFDAGWDINNSNGKEKITLNNIEQKIINSDAFVFTPGASLEDLFKAISVFVGYQTLDKHLAAKPTVILNNDDSWDYIFNLLTHLNKLGTVKQDYRDYLLTAENSDEVAEILEAFLEKKKGLPPIDREPLPEPQGVPIDANTPAPDDLLGNVCVFCSASIEKEGYINDGITLGRQLAENKLGCVSGAGKTGIMGAVVKGSVDAKGWTAGSNVPHIIELEGLPTGLSCFWLRDDIYTRMEVMIENSNAFVIFPGGAGTIQELLALLIFQQQDHELMRGKPIVIFNRLDSNGDRFWEPLVDLLPKFCSSNDYLIVDELDEIIPAIKAKLK